MKIFVTGVAGQLGHDVMNELASRGYVGVGTDLAKSYSGIQDGSYVTTAEYVALDITNKEAVINTIKSVTGGLKAFSEYSTEQQEELEEIFKYLKDNNIYILHNGALEDYYNKQEIDRLKQENSLGKAKEVVAHYISTILTADNINNLLVIDNDFKDYVMDIINCISDNSNVITMNDDDIYDDLD